ncbi:MAG: six-hairpin glycosidase [Acidobacteria bacterium]|nr:MAG: six-hairpin glycosidase [Acidobacteriota bacterium]
MTNVFRVALGTAVVVSLAAQTAPPHDYPVVPVPFTAVHLNDVFWAPRIEINRKVTIPAAFQQCELTGRVDNFVRAAQALRGEKPANTKVIEGASYTLNVVPDPKLDAYVDSLIEKIAAAQEPDGYLYPARTIDPQHPHRWSGAERWVNERNDSHELYNLGHLFEAAVAHYQATGKKTLLNVALKSADLLVKTFGPGKRSIWPGHQITEMGLVKLYRVTGNEQYLNLAKFLLDQRGPGPLPPGETVNPRGLEYNQAQAPVIDQTEPVGHAVRAMYMYSGMADVAALENDAALRAAGDRIWESLVRNKLYLTGGIGAAGGHEGFGKPYELPNMTAYNETCASVGMDFWNMRQFLLHGDAKYVDVMERTLFNGLVSGVSIDGKTFFYDNPLESNGQHARREWFGVACCPGNITRFMASVPGYIYATRGDTLYVNLFAGGTADITTPGGKLTVDQQTRYPWDGLVRMTMRPDRARRFAVDVRIPGWARNEPVPSDLYRFLDPAPAPPALTVNGQRVAVTMSQGYVTIDRTWRAGDVIELNLPMPVRRIVAHEQVEADRGRVALQRGPIVYAAEWADNPNGRVRNLVVPDETPLTAEFRPDLLNGVEIVKGRARALAYDAQGKVTTTDQAFTAIPYSTWANRGRGQMAVWIARTDAAGKPAPFPTIATASKVTTSGRKNPEPIHDGEDPSSSDDPSSYFDWWPRKGTTEWIEYGFEKPTAVSEVQVYWFDDTGRGEVRVPASWRLLYKDGDGWKPVAAAGPYGIERNRFNAVRFDPVTTSGLRLEVTAQPQWSIGVQEWKVK